MSTENHPYKEYGEIKADHERYSLTLERMPGRLAGKVLDLGVENPFTPLLKQSYPELQITNTSPNIDFDTMPLPYPDQSFDYVFSFEVIEHLINPLWNMQECRRVLREDGKIILTTPKGVFPSFMWMDTHFHEIDRGRLEFLFSRAGLKVLKLDEFNKRPSYWLKMGLFRPALRIVFGGWFYAELEKEQG